MRRFLAGLMFVLVLCSASLVAAFPYKSLKEGAAKASETWVIPCGLAYRVEEAGKFYVVYSDSDHVVVAEWDGKYEPGDGSPPQRITTGSVDKSGKLNLRPTRKFDPAVDKGPCASMSQVES